MQPHRHLWTALLCIALAVLAGTAGAANRVSITLDPPNFAVDEASELTITISGD